MNIPKATFEKLVDMVSTCLKHENYELEAKFNNFTSDNFTTLLKYLRSIDTEEIIHAESLDISFSDNRITIDNKADILEYCKSKKIPKSATFMKKRKVQNMPSLYFDQLNCKVDLRIEEPLESLDYDNNVQHFFRLKKRFTYELEFYKIDLTIVRSAFSLAEAMTAAQKYEIEIEFKSGDAKDLLKGMLEVYSVLRNEDFLIPQVEKDNILVEYLQLTYKLKGTINIREIYSKPKMFFIGPQPITLEQKNIIAPELGVISIQKGYTVTEKADGERMLLFFNKDGRAYYINSRLNVKFTGVKSKTVMNTVLDGEYINSKNQYAIFDLYWHDNGQDVRSIDLDERVRLAQSIVNKTRKIFNNKLFVKSFYGSSDIFQDSCKILEQKFDYYIDGLIYTPKGSVSKQVFKWKPPHDNTIDFLIRMPKNFTIKDGVKYRILELYVGYNPVQWEMISPLAFLENKLNRTKNYIAKGFDVLNDEDFTKCFMKIEHENQEIKCLNNDTIYDKSIVECKYVDNKWLPIRVRHDKTEMFQTSGLSGTANDYGVAINIWRSITYPVDKDMICGKKTLTSKDIPNDDVYYYRTTTRDQFASKPMLDFHNYWIKNKALICGEYTQGKTSLFDISCGQGGDLPKWIEHNYTRVLGVDIARDNIENPVNGIYARLLENKKYDASKHKYVFVTLDSSKKFTREYFDSLAIAADKNITLHLWGHVELPKVPHFKFATNKFDVVSCQFSIHYFFESEKTLDNFLWNVNEHLSSEGGRFIGTCLDGFKIKEKLRNKTEVSGQKDDKTLWYMRRGYKKQAKTIDYGEEVFIYMESIGKVIKEYLVNFDLLVTKLAQYNIQLTHRESFEETYNKVAEEKMTDIDKEYSFMNMWFVFTKMTPPPKKVPKKKIT